MVSSSIHCEDKFNDIELLYVTYFLCSSATFNTQAKQSKKCQFALEDQATVETLNHLFQDLRVRMKIFTSDRLYFMKNRHSSFGFSMNE